MTVSEKEAAELFKAVIDAQGRGHADEIAIGLIAVALRATAAEIERLQSALAQAQADAAHWENAHKGLNIDLGIRVQEIERLLGERNRLTDLVAQLRARITEQDEQMDRADKHTAGLMQTIEQAQAEVERLKEGHCKDCCCARSWEALGNPPYSGVSIPEHIAQLRQQLAEREAEIEGLKALDNSLAPCGHSSRLCHTEDGGKHIQCYACQLAAKDAEITQLKLLADGLTAKLEAAEQERDQWKIVHESSSNGQNALIAQLKVEAQAVRLKALRDFNSMVERRLERLSENPENGYVEVGTNAFIWTNDDAEYAACELDELAGAITALIEAEESKSLTSDKPKE